MLLHRALDFLSDSLDIWEDDHSFVLLFTLVLGLLGLSLLAFSFKQLFLYLLDGPGRVLAVFNACLT